ncbi:hypothetical protein SynNOUM97013_00643 [Synechococcus sp. NOUM97013]|nr:hypothetical protein SynNOUM97013_00643 [Synechococcus sp. NOUM97013]
MALDRNQALFKVSSCCAPLNPTLFSFGDQEREFVIDSCSEMSRFFVDD